MAKDPRKFSMPFNDVNPRHYKAGDIYELVNVIEAYGLDKDWALATAATYIFRCGQKPGSDPITDLKKAIWYIERRIKQGFEEE